jgi:hypothetical protein
VGDVGNSQLPNFNAGALVRVSFLARVAEDAPGGILPLEWWQAVSVEWHVGPDETYQIVEIDPL